MINRFARAGGSARLHSRHPAMTRSREGWMGLGFVFGFATAAAIGALLFIALPASILNERGAVAAVPANAGVPGLGRATP